MNEFCTSEKENFDKKLQRTISSETLFDKENFKLRDEAFHVNFVNLFVKNKSYPPEILWHYLDFYR